MSKLRKMISLILVFSCMATSSVPAFASQLSTPAGSVSVTDDGIVKVGDYIIKTTEDDERTVITLTQNGTVLSESVLYRKTGRIVTTTGDDTSEMWIANFRSTQSQVNRAPTSYSNMGRIRYKYVDGSGSGICGVNLSYASIINPYAEYNIRGTYKGVTGLVATLIGFFALPHVIASKIAAEIFAYFGFGLSLVALIPDCKVSAKKTTYSYKLTDMDYSGHTNYIDGSKYVVTRPGSNKTYTEGNFFQYSPMGDVGFGMTVYNSMFTYSNWKIYAWN